MKKLLIAPLMGLILLTVGCTPIERLAYNTAVGAKAFLNASKAQHPECASGAQSAVCADLVKATHAKDFLVDAAEAYCGGADFDNGGQCDAPKKGDSRYAEAVAMLKAAIAGYNQAASDLKGAL